MSQNIREQLAHVLWLGGATDAGKSTIAKNLASHHNMHVYHYDKFDAVHHEKLAETVIEIRRFVDASLEERWVYPEPSELFARSLNSFAHRFPLVIEDLLDLPRDRLVIAEGFGLLPELVHPLLSSHNQAVWLVPTERFKLESMTRRGKPSFGKVISNPEKVKTNLVARDRMLADYYRKQVGAFGYTLIEIDGSHSVEEMTETIHSHFAGYQHST